MNKTDKFFISVPEVCSDAMVSSNTTCSRLISNKDDEIPTLNPDTPLNPRMQPVNEVEVIPV